MIDFYFQVWFFSATGQKISPRQLGYIKSSFPNHLPLEVSAFDFAEQPEWRFLPSLKQELSGMSGFYRQLRSNSCFIMPVLNFLCHLKADHPFSRGQNILRTVPPLCRAVHKIIQAYFSTDMVVPLSYMIRPE